MNAGRKGRDNTFSLSGDSERLWIVAEFSVHAVSSSEDVSNYQGDSVCVRCAHWCEAVGTGRWRWRGVVFVCAVARWWPRVCGNLGNLCACGKVLHRSNVCSGSGNSALDSGQEASAWLHHFCGLFSSVKGIFDIFFLPWRPSFKSKALPRDRPQRSLLLHLPESCYVI